MTTGLQNLGNSIIAVKDFISKSYMKQFADPSCKALEIGNARSVIVGLRLLKVEQIALSDELIESRLTSVYQALSQLVNSCFVIMQGTSEGISLYIGFQSDAAGTAEKALTQTLLGNFPGIILKSLKASEIQSVTERMKSNSEDGLKTISSVSVVPSRREEQGTTGNVQGMEKFIDSMQGQEFTAVIIATPYSDYEVNKRILSLESISTALSSLEKTTVQDTQTQTITITDATAQTISNTINNSISNAYSSGTSLGSVNQQGKGRGVTVTPMGLAISLNGQRGSAATQAKTAGISAGHVYGTAVGRADMTSQALGQTQGVARTVAKTEINKEVQNLREKIDRQTERLRQSEAQGLWDCCGYFVANSNETAIIAANSFQGLVSGDSTNVEQSVINLWQPTLPSDPVSNHRTISNIVEALSLGVAPVFSVNGLVRRTESVVTGNELSRMMGFPRKSAGTVSVIKMASFGRSIHLAGGRSKEAFKQRSFPVGNVVHMGRIDMREETRLELEKLNAHVFAAGATGTGKTTAIGDVLHQLSKNHISFTVIEPAKGEYGDIWGRLPGIEVYSTTPFRYRMLKINPFAFEENVHILNHMELLISVFSTAWPLYAAQPAVLRECVRLAYTRCGWDITNSVCLLGHPVFPTFKDVLTELPGVIKKSKFVGEARGTYEGALQTRLSMLTEGIFKDLFCSKRDISNAELFDRNVIVDLSRLGSQETLSLVMGILLIRLYEHRINQGKSRYLTHVTVLEEAHNILKSNTSGPQGEDVASIVSKSVEVLTKCITELRFTGEGFIIVDQSPGEVDSTAIKNTATKIIMRLPERNDQKAVGSALALTESQMAEISKLDKGVAVVFQEGWVEPVLTKFNDYEKPYSVRDSDIDLKAEVLYSDMCEVRGFLMKIVLKQFSDSVYDLEEYTANLQRISGFSKWKLADYKDLFTYYNRVYEQIKANFKSNRVRYPFFGKLIRELLDADYLFNVVQIPEPDKTMSKPYSEDHTFIDSCNEWKKTACMVLENYCKNLTWEEKNLGLKLMLLADGEKEKKKILVCATAF